MSNEPHLYVSPEVRTSQRVCAECGLPEDTPLHHVVSAGWCQWDDEDHDWTPGDMECRRCGADLSEWNEES
jgi:ribosomal protein L37E